ncbi:unnamed protein product [Onchocerca flexuosa]|uniref:Col_cuticle_N domain-containing protein n=1 Tax=Onchocerca flexuosa TaxID=387005 RepID=A0A183I033_9BILA|nr:unnamed protein product [Onchocerca flexuosa]
MFEKASSLEEQQQLRRSAFLAVVISIAAVIASIITLPMIYSFVATFQSHLLREIEYCKTRTRDINTKFSLLSSEDNVFTNNRKKRNSYNYSIRSSTPPSSIDQYPQISPNTNSKPALSSCCSCQQGPVGQQGPAGDDGLPGIDGKPGVDGGYGPRGKPGRDGKSSDGPIGPRGAPGLAGKRGIRGNAGLPGIRGKSGENGGCGHCPKPRLPSGY